MADKRERKTLALKALQGGMRDRIVDIPVNDDTALRCRFIPIGYIAANLIDSKTAELMLKRRKQIQQEYADGTRTNQTRQQIDTLLALADTYSDDELRQMAQNADRQNLDEIETDGKTTYKLREPRDYDGKTRSELVDYVKKQVIAGWLLGMEAPVFDNYMPEWYGLSEEEIKSMSIEDRQHRRRQIMDAEHTRRRDQVVGLPLDRVYSRLDQASAQAEANDEVSRHISAVRLWTVTRTEDDRNAHYFEIPNITSLAGALDNPKHVHTEMMKLLQEDDILLATFVRAYNAYMNSLEVPGTELDEVAKEPFRSELPAAGREDQSDAGNGGDVGGSGVPSQPDL